MPDIKYFSNVQSKSTGDVYVVKDEGAREQIDDIWKANGMLGAKNLIPYPYADGESKSYRNMTYTVNPDGTITATATQTLTDDATFYLYGPTDTDEFVLKAGVTYVLSGDPTSSGAERIVVSGRSAAGETSETIIINNSGVPKEYTPDEDKVITNIYIRNYTSTTTPYNETFKPMLRLASDTDDTYQPYAKTNRQLTEDIAVPKYDPVDECIYYEGGDQFTGAIDSAPTAGSSNAVSSGGTKTYVDSAIAGVSISGQYAECSTARNVAAKTVTLPGFELKTGSKITIRFTDTGSSNPESGNLTLNVNGTGPKEIVDAHTNMTKMTYTSNWFYNNLVNDFIYDGTYWVWMSRDNNTTYTSKAAASGGTATSLCTTGEKYTWNNKQNALTFDSAPTQGSGNPVTSGGVFSSLGVPKIDTTTGVMYLEGGAAFSGNIDSTPTAGSNNAVASGGVYTALNERVKIAAVNGSVDSVTADSTAIGGYRTTGSNTKPLSSFSGYPTGKTIVGWSLTAYGSNGAVQGIVNVASGYVYLNTAYSGTFTVNGFVFYKD